MTEEVLVSVKGLQLMNQDQEDEQEESVEVLTGGKYMEKNGVHYVHYEEMLEGLDGPTQNLVKFYDNKMEVTKKGAVNVKMLFEKHKKTMSTYETPYGELIVGVETQSVEVCHREDSIEAVVKYALEMNYEHLADCTLSMKVRSKKHVSL